jgi:hypothetical protein
MAANLEKTIKSVEESIKNHSTTGASTSINSWIKTLSETKGLKPIADDLEKLKEAISDKDGAEIAKLLDKVGQATSKAAEDADDDSKKTIAKLGKALVAGGKAVKALAKDKEKEK